ncbi:hypothetical protein DL765_007217 [Monosporascus sp. GIB2]|nr:hypothetical protein DL765_007217 [Monosporascus sp. GIB2]
MMASNSEKTSQHSDHTPEVIKKIVSEIGESQEKLRAVLNLLFVPRFKPSFIDPRDYSLSGLKDVEFLETPDTGGTQRPFRMFDLDTGNLVEHWTISPLDPYCMLSHRWRGDEITLAYIRGARAKDVDPKATRKNDVELVLDRSEQDVLEQQRIIKSLIHHALEQERELEREPIEKSPVYDAHKRIIKSLDHEDVGDLLNLRIEAKHTMAALESARKDDDSARSKVELARMEKVMFDDILKGVGDKIDKTKGDGATECCVPATQDDRANVTPSPAGTKSDNSTNGVVNKLSEEAAEAKRKLEAAQQKQKDTREYANFFDRNSQLREAVDEMISRLQRWKSANKIGKAVDNARMIFGSRLFLKRDKRYLWLDTCCIDKQNHGELSQSLSLMGDWYAQADFCLAQLDTDWREDEAVDEWVRFKKEKPDPDSPRPVKPIIKSFDDIGKPKSDTEKSKKAEECTPPEWARRGWTLQELVMSKMIFFVNSEWNLLSRPVEFLGYFYPLIPFIELYTRGDKMNIYSDALKAKGCKQPDVLESWSSDDRWVVLRDHISHTDEGLVKCMDELPLTPIEQRDRANDELPLTPIEQRDRANDELPLTPIEQRDRAKKALRLIFLLKGLGLRMPNDMTRETAISEMARAVYLAATGLISKEADSAKSSKNLFNRLKQSFLPKTKGSEEEAQDATESQNAINVREVQDAINFLLACLVSETKPLIASDRKSIAKFGQVNQLDTWKEGIRRSGFPTERVMELSCKRISTIPTDHVYSLMGILGVRFPTFPAEGYSKALSRLLDEVLITHNDVSVFNWTGVQMGSPIRGRSLYPASHEAFRNDEDRGRRYNMVIAAEGHKKRRKVMETYHGIIQMLRDAIDCIRDKERKGLLPLDWIWGIAILIQTSTFEDLHPELKSLGKIIGYIRDHCVQPLLPNTDVEKPAESTITTPSPGEITSPSFKIRPPFAGLKLGSGKKESDSSAIKTSKFSGFGKGMKPSFSRHSSELVEKPVAEEPATLSPATPHSPDDKIKSSFDNKIKSSFDNRIKSYFDDKIKSSIDDSTKSSFDGQQAWNNLNTNVMRYLEDIESKKEAKDALPSEIQKVEFKAPEPEEARKTSGDVAPNMEAESLVSPNPIIISNSGIEGIFDIQRIIVTMIDREKLLQKVAKAASPTQKISGWCTISTGFANVVVNFACEQRILRRQLEIVKTVEDRVIREQVRAEKLHRDLEIEEARAEESKEGGEKSKTGGEKSKEGGEKPKEGGETPTTDDNVRDGGNDGGDLGEVEMEDGKVTGERQTKDGKDTGEGQTEDGKVTGESQAEDGKVTGERQTKDGKNTREGQMEDGKDTYKSTKEERMVARIIDFIQEPDLQLVAGEWVLARFSGVGGAKWFLCCLELGSTHQFYGHRIATSDIDFTTSAVESGLVDVWHTYMNRKKTMMCNILMKYLESSGGAWKGKDKLRQGADFASQNLGLGKGMGVKSPQTAKSPSSPANDDDKVDGSESDESESVTLVENSRQKRSLLDGMRDQSKHAAMSLGEHTLRALYEKFLEMHAKHLDKHLAVSVLKKTPKSLRTAVENMDENKDFLPAMFHSAIRVHMF